jgi:hypothetical protein
VVQTLRVSRGDQAASAQNRLTQQIISLLKTSSRPWRSRVRLKTSSRPLRSRVALNSFAFARSSASWPLQRTPYCVPRWVPSSLRKRMPQRGSCAINQWVFWGCLELIAGMRPGPPVSGRPSLPLVSVHRSRPWRSCNSRLD